MPGFANLWSPLKVCWDVNGIFMFVLPEHLQAYRKKRVRASFARTSLCLCRATWSVSLCSVEMIGGTRTSDRKTCTRRQVPTTGRFCFQGHGGMDRVAVDNASRMSMILRTEI